VNTETQGNEVRVIGGEVNETVIANAFKSVGNDLMENIGINASKTVGGAITETIANASPSGPSVMAVDRLIAIGGERTRIVGIGDIVKEIVGGGNFTVTTSAGGISLVAVAPASTFNLAIGSPPTLITVGATGDLTLSTGMGTVLISKATGNITVNGNIGQETFTTSKAITSPLVQLGPAPAFPMINVQLLALALNIWAATFISTTPGNPVVFAPLVPAALQAATGSLTCFMSA
jgi:hypothetical protein